MNQRRTPQSRARPTRDDGRRDQTAAELVAQHTAGAAPAELREQLRRAGFQQTGPTLEAWQQLVHHPTPPPREVETEVLAHCLAAPDPDLAWQFFAALHSRYGLPPDGGTRLAHRG